MTTGQENGQGKRPNEFHYSNA